jgi:hypothetical protein
VLDMKHCTMTTNPYSSYNDLKAQQTLKPKPSQQESSNTNIDGAKC